MKKVILITEKVLDYIKAHETEFSELKPLPKKGELWRVTDEVTYPTACNGEPVVEAEFEDGRWMRIPADTVQVKTLNDKSYKYFSRFKNFPGSFLRNAIEHANKKQTAGLINVSFDGKCVFENEEKGTVTVETTAYVHPKTDQFKHIGICVDDVIRTKGQAKCSSNDNFSQKKGYLIASSRSENEAYYEAIKTLEEICYEADQVAKAAKYRIQLLKECAEHNKNFINDVANGK